MAAAKTQTKPPTTIPVTELCCPALLACPLEEDQAEEMAALLKALADPVRLRLVSLVAASPSGELCACDLPEALGRSQATVSHHLSQLVKAGVLAREQRGKWAWFQIRTQQFEAIRAALAVPS
jgi:ArsR family transcriptional regulator, arsenate/arsenite/antimonite-responsive transcriptional repressor